MHEIHPLALCLSPLTKKEYDDLKADIQKRGRILRPIVLFQGKVLSGAHRERICHELGIEPTYETFEGTEEEAARLVESLELLIRSITASQKAMVVESLRAMGQGVSTEGVSRRTRMYARKVLKEGHEDVQKAVRDGDMAVSSAARDIVHLPKEEQQRVVKDARSGVKKKKQQVEVDFYGVPIPPGLRDVFGTDVIAGSSKMLREVVSAIGSLQTWHPYLLHAKLREQLESALRQLEANIPTAVCPSCSGVGCRDACRGTGWLPKWRVDELGYTGVA